MGHLIEDKVRKAYSHSKGRGTPVEYRSASLSSTSLVVLPILTIFGIAGLVKHKHFLPSDNDLKF